MLLINNQEVERLLDMKSCLEALEDGYDDLLKGDAVYRPRLDVWMPCDRPDGYYRWGTMEGASRKIGVFAIRMKSDIVHWPNGDTEEKYCMQPGTWCGLVMVFSVRNGEPLAIINDGLIQRSGNASRHRTNAVKPRRRPAPGMNARKDAGESAR